MNKARLLAFLLGLVTAILLLLVLLVIHHPAPAERSSTTPHFESIYPDVLHTPDTTTTVPLPAVPNAAPKISADALYIVLVQRNHAMVVNDPTVTDTMGHRICDYRAAGHSTEDAITTLMDTVHMDNGDAVSADAATLFVTSAELAFCPQYQ